jgi:hypothetical protein
MIPPAQRPPQAPPHHVGAVNVRTRSIADTLARKSHGEWAGGSTRRSAAEPGPMWGEVRAVGRGQAAGYSGWGLEDDLLAGEVLELADQVTLAASLVDLGQ